MFRCLVFLHEAVNCPISNQQAHAGSTLTRCVRGLAAKYPLDRSTVWRRIRKDPEFPKPFYLWDAAPRFVEEEIDAYILRKIAERDDPACAAAQRERLRRREQWTGEARAMGESW